MSDDHDQANATMLDLTPSFSRKGNGASAAQGTLTTGRTDGSNASELGAQDSAGNSAGGGQGSSFANQAAGRARSAGQARQAQGGVTSDTATGVKSFFRGVSRYVRHEGRLLGQQGLGEQAQAAHVEHMLLGEAIGLALHANEEIIDKGYEVLSENKTMLIARQGSAMLTGAALGGTAGPSLSLVAGMGDVYYNIEQVALEFKIFATTVDPRQPILPQLPENVRTNLSGRLEGIVNTYLLGRDK